MSDHDPLGVEGALEARLELVQPALEKDLFGEHLLTVQVDLAIVDARWVGQPGPWLATLPDLRLQACLYHLDELNFLADVVPRLLYRECLRDLAVAVFKLAERAARTLACRAISVPAEDLQDRQVLLLVAHGHLLQQERRCVPSRRRGLAPRVRRLVVHIKHVLCLFHVMTLRVNCDPPFSIDAFQIVRLLALDSDRFQ